MEKVKTHSDYKAKYQDNQDTHTRKMALDKIIAEVMNHERRRELELINYSLEMKPLGLECLIA